MKRLDPQTALRDLGRRVAELRRARELTQEQLAEAIGVSTRYVQRIEAGEENLTVESVVTLANALEAHLLDLFAPPASRTRPVGRPRRRLAE